MLVLTRKSDQSILIGDDIEIMVTEIRQGKVRLGINAPRDVLVQRTECAGKFDPRAAIEGGATSQQKESA
jgi:carbon storage regulator CsrA